MHGETLKFPPYILTTIRR